MKLEAFNVNGLKLPKLLPDAVDFCGKPTHVIRPGSAYVGGSDSFI